MSLLRNLILALLTCLSAPSGVWAQADTVVPPYAFGVVREAGYAVAAGGSRLLGHELRRKTESVLLGDLRLGTVPFYDRYTPSRKHDGSRVASDITLEVSAALPLLLLAGRRSRRDAFRLGILLVETMALNQGLTDIIKATAHRARPYLHDAALPPDTVVDPKDRIAFVSGHTSVSAASCFFMATVFADYYPESKLKPIVWAVAAALPAATAVLRLRAGQHYPSDVVAGYLLGAGIGYGIPALHRIHRRGSRLRVEAEGPGLSLVYRLE